VDNLDEIALGGHYGSDVLVGLRRFIADIAFVEHSPTAQGCAHIVIANAPLACSRDMNAPAPWLHDWNESAFAQTANDIRMGAHRARDDADCFARG